MSKVHVSLTNEAQVRQIRYHNTGISYIPYVGGHVHAPKKSNVSIVWLILALVMLTAALAGAWGVYTYLLMVV